MLGAGVMQVAFVHLKPLTGTSVYIVMCISNCKSVHLQWHACTPCCVTIPVVSDVQAQHVALHPCEVMLAWSGHTQQLCARASEPPMLTQQLCCAHAQLQPPSVLRQTAQWKLAVLPMSSKVIARFYTSGTYRKLCHRGHMYTTSHGKLQFVAPKLFF